MAPFQIPFPIMDVVNFLQQRGIGTLDDLQEFLVGVEQGVRETAEGKPASPPPSGCRAGDKPRVRKENIFPDSCVLEIEVPGYNKDLVRVKAEANKTFTVTLKNDPKLKGMDQKFP